MKDPLPFFFAEFFILFLLFLVPRTFIAPMLFLAAVLGGTIAAFGFNVFLFVLFGFVSFGVIVSSSSNQELETKLRTFIRGFKRPGKPRPGEP